MGTGAFLLAALKVLPLVLNLISMFKRSADEKVQRGLGYDQAVKESLEEGAARLKLARKAEQEALQDHAAHPTTDDAFDQDFARKG